MLIFAGQHSIENVRKYRNVILKSFDSSFQLIPSRGFTHLLVHGMPCIRRPDGSLPSSADILKELTINVPFQGATIIDGPTWSHAIVTDPTKEKGAMSFILIDETNTTATNMCCGQIWAYGVCVTVRCGIPSYPFRQCSRCHELSHSTEACSRLADVHQCAACGQTGHVLSEHKSNCRQHNASPGCNCALWCFNCNRAKKNPVRHIATDDACPLKKDMRRESPGLSQTTKSASPLGTTTNNMQVKPRQASAAPSSVASHVPATPSINAPLLEAEQI